MHIQQQKIREIPNPRLSIPSLSSICQIEPSQTPTASNISSPTDPSSFLLDKETTRELPPDIIATLSKLLESDIKKLSVSPSILVVIATLSIERSHYYMLWYRRTGEAQCSPVSSFYL